MQIYTVILLFFGATNFLDTASGSNILFLLPIGFKSHTHVFQPLIQGLAAKDHNLTVVTSSPYSQLPPNVYQISPVSLDSVVESFGNIFEVRKMGRLAFSASFNVDLLLSISKQAYANAEFRQIISQEYDLIIMNGFVNEAFMGVLPKIGAPFILVTTMPSPAGLTQYTGNYLPPSFVPVPFWDLTHHMTFPERLLNYLINIFFDLSLKLMYRSKYEAIYREELGADLPGLDVILGNMSLLFMNSHFSLNYPRPNLPDNIEVGGLHCGPPKALPRDLEEFVSGSKDGFIYFSLGSIIRTSQMPEEYRKIFVNVFSRLKHRVLWKWETEEMADLPPNVKLAKWVPQQDVLGHDKIRVFITHGGLLSTQEAAYHGVPLLGIPLFADQDLNMMKSEAQGFALTLELLNMTEIEMEDKLKQLLNEPRFTASAKKLSSIVRDQTETPLERAIYWAEYVIRHKGAPHLRSAARNLNHLQANSYDVIAFLIFIFGAFLFVLKTCFMCIFRRLQRKPPLVKQEHQKRKKLN